MKFFNATMTHDSQPSRTDSRADVRAYHELATARNHCKAGEACTVSRGEYGILYWVVALPDGSFLRMTDAGAKRHLKTQRTASGKPILSTDTAATTSRYLKIRNEKQRGDVYHGD